MADTVIFNNPSMAFVDTGMGLFLWQEMPSTITLTVGETYLVEWNGEQFNCVAVAANLNGVDGIGIGNLALAGVGDNTNEPFLLGVGADGSFSACYTVENNATNQMVITHVAEEDKEYLIWGSTLKDIANAIRSKSGATEEIAVTDMASKISEISGGGSGADVVYVTFMNHDGTKELHKRAVVPGNSCMCPVTGVIKELDTPTRESTAQYDYTFAGWSTEVNGGLNENALKNVTEDRTVYANYIASVRTYTISYFDDDGSPLYSETLPYGAMPSYVPEKDGSSFGGWTPALTTVVADASYTASWRATKSFADATWEEIAEVCDSGKAASTYAVGDKKTVPVTIGGTTYNYIAKIVGIEHDDLADGSGKAGLSIVFFTLDKTSAYETSNYDSRYHYSDLKSNIEAFKNYLPQELQSVIKTVKKTENYKTSGMYGTTDERQYSMWVPTMMEVTGETYAGSTAGYAKSIPGTQYAAFVDAPLGSGINEVYSPSGSPIDTGMCWLMDYLTNKTMWGYKLDELARLSFAQTTVGYMLIGFCV